MTYSSRFQTRQQVNEYLDVYSDRTNYANLLYEIETNFLEKTCSDFVQGNPDSEYLDFAVGTGRIIKIVSKYVKRSNGVDISDEMVGVARQSCPDSIINKHDIIEVPVIGSFDVVTAFRFFLNAEPELREKVAERLRMNLRNEDSVFIFNNHGRLMSIKIVPWISDKLRSRIFKRQARQNYMSDWYVRNKIVSSNFVVVEEYGYGVLGEKLSKVVGLSLARIVENKLAGSRAAHLFGTCRIYVVTASG